MRSKDLRTLNPMVSKDLSVLSSKQLMAYAVKAQGLLEEVRNYELAKRAAYDSLKDINTIVRQAVKEEISKVEEKAATLEFKSEEECLDNFYLELDNNGRVSVPKNVVIAPEVVNTIPSLEEELFNYKKSLDMDILDTKTVEEGTVNVVNDSTKVNVDLICQIMCDHYGACMTNNEQAEVRLIELAEDYVSSIEEGRENIALYEQAIEELSNCTNVVVIDSMKQALSLIVTVGPEEDCTEEPDDLYVSNSETTRVNVFVKPINDISTVKLYDGYHNTFKYGTVEVNGNKYMVEAASSLAGPTVYDVIDVPTILAVKAEIEKAYGKDYFSGSTKRNRAFRGTVLNSEGKPLNAQCVKIDVAGQELYEGFINKYWFQWDKTSYDKPVVVKAIDYCKDGTFVKCPKVPVNAAVLAAISQAIEGAKMAANKGGGTNA